MCLKIQQLAKNCLYHLIKICSRKLDDEKDPFDFDHYLNQEQKRNKVGRFLLQEGYIFPSTSCLKYLNFLNTEKSYFQHLP